jgi:outer membrane lipoprotein carrier protein
MILKQWILMLGMMLLVGQVLAGDPIKQLNDFHHKVKSFQAHFTQQVLDAQGELQQEAQGLLYIQRPGRFRWDYQTPYEQLILADGKKLWIYDVDLEQVTVKNIDEALGQTPAMMLSGDDELEGTFNISALPSEEGLDWVALTPKSKDSSFVRMTLGFLNGELIGMMLEDSFSQLTSVRFSNTTRNAVITNDMFEFTAPDGVDVIGDVD